jgi:hypothetical protein
MPDINYTITGQVQKGALSQSFAASGITADIATAGVLSVTLALDTNSTQISTATLGSVGLCFARSLATTTTHEVSIGRLDGTVLHETVRLKAGEAAVLRLAPGDYAAKAAVAGTTRVVLTIYED